MCWWVCGHMCECVSVLVREWPQTLISLWKRKPVAPNEAIFGFKVYLNKWMLSVFCFYIKDSHPRGFVCIVSVLFVWFGLYMQRGSCSGKCWLETCTCFKYADCFLSVTWTLKEKGTAHPISWLKLGLLIQFNPVIYWFF